MKTIFISILIFCFSQSVFSQESFVINRTYTDLTFNELVTELEKTENLRFYYKQEWIDSIRVNKIQKGTSFEDALKYALRGAELKFYMEKKDVFIYQGRKLISELPAYEYSSKKEMELSILNDSIVNETKFIKTGSRSGENYITIGDKKNAIRGKRSRVRGSITNILNGEPMIGATVYIQELATGTATDVNGRFQLRLFPGKYRITVNHMAMKEMHYGLNVLSDGFLTIELENELIELEEITVTDKRHSNVEGMLMGFERISTKSMKEIPVVLGEKDVIKIVQMLPGVQNAGEGSSGFNVRGGTADQNMFYINKISVYNTSHLFGFFTAFSPDIISDFSLYKNNIPSKFGGRIASIFEINTRQGNKSNFFAQGGISPITGHFSIEGPVIKEKVSFVASWRSTYSDWILNQMNDNDLRKSDASFYDGTFGLNAKINPKNTLEAFIYQSSDKFSLSDRNDYSYSNTGGSVSWKHSFSTGFSADFSISSSDYNFSTNDKNNITEAYTHDYFIKHSEARADFLYVKNENHRIEFGVNSVLYDLNRGEIIPYGEESKRIPINLGNEQGIENAVYFSDEFELFTNMDLLLGLRYSHYGQLGPADIQNYEEGLPKNKYNYTDIESYEAGEFIKTYSGFEPRLALNYGISPKTSVKASYNRLRQYIFLLSNTIAIAPNDQWKLTDYHITPPVSDQVSLGFYHDFKDRGLNLSVEIYKKWVNNVVEYKDGADFISSEPLETQVLQGSQDSKGVEFMLKKNNDKLKGWVSYAYSRSTILIDGKFDEEKVNNGLAYPSNFDRPHSFNLVSNYRISRRLSFSSNVVYSTGRPVTLPIATYYSEEQQYLLYSDRNEYRIPDYFRVDLSVNLEGNLRFKKVAHSFWMLNVYNLTGRHNAYSIFYEVVENQVRGYQFSVFAQPIVTLSWNFKFGNYNSD